MNHQWLVSSFTVSSLIHLSLIPLAALIMHTKPLKPITVPIELVDVPNIEQPEKVVVAPLPSAPNPQRQNISAPKLLSKPVLEKSFVAPTGNTKDEVKPEKPREETPQLASLPDKAGDSNAGWNAGSRVAEAEGSAAGAGSLFGNGDVGVVGGSGVEGGGGGKGSAGLGRGIKVTAPAAAVAAEKHSPPWLGHSVAIKSSRAIRSRREASWCARRNDTKSQRAGERAGW